MRVRVYEGDDTVVGMDFRALKSRRRLRGREKFILGKELRGKQVICAPGGESFFLWYN